MKNIKKIIAAVTLTLTMLSGIMGVNCYESAEGYIIENPGVYGGRQIIDDEILYKIYPEYFIALSKDYPDYIRLYNGISFQSSNGGGGVYISLKEPIITSEYTNSEDYIISGSLPTVEDFPELDGICEINLQGLCSSLDPHQPGENYIFDKAFISFETLEQTYAAYKILSKDKNPVMGDDIIRGANGTRMSVMVHYMTWYNTLMTLNNALGIDDCEEYHVMYDNLVRRANAESNVEIPEPIIYMYDVNGDGEVNTVDLTIIAKYISRPVDFDTFVSEYQADINRDGKINADDLLYMIKKLTGEIQ